MRYIIVILTTLLSFFCFAQAEAQGVSAFGATRPQDTSKTRGQIVAPVLADSDSNTVIGVTSTGQFVKRTKSNITPIDTSLFLKKTDTSRSRMIATYYYVDSLFDNIPATDLSSIRDTLDALYDSLADIRSEIANIPQVDTQYLRRDINSLGDTVVVFRTLLNRHSDTLMAHNTRINQRVKYSDSDVVYVTPFDNDTAKANIRAQIASLPTPNLQQVTNAGNTTTNVVTVRRLQVDDSFDNGSPDAQIKNISKYTSVYFPFAAGHFIKDNGLFTRTTAAYASYDAEYTMTGRNFNHTVPWQSRYIINDSGTTTNAYTLFSANTYNIGRLSDYKQIHLEDMAGTGTGHLHRSLYIAPLIWADTSWPIYVAGVTAKNRCWFGGGVATQGGSVFGGTPFDNPSYTVDVRGTANVTGVLSTQVDAILNTNTAGKGAGTGVIFGLNAGAAVTSGTSTYTYVGRGAGRNDLGDGRNTAVGENALLQNVTGSYNAALGRDALGGSIGQDYNFSTGLGMAAGLNTYGSDNIFIGAFAGFNLGAINNRLQVGTLNYATPLLIGDLQLGRFGVNMSTVPSYTFEVSSNFGVGSDGKFKKYGGTTPIPSGQVLVGDGTDMELSTVENLATDFDETSVITSNITITPTKIITFRLVDATSGNITITLNAARGQLVKIQRTDATANTVTVVGSSGQINGAASKTIPPVVTERPTFSALRAQTNYFMY